MEKISIDTLRRLDPISSMSDARLAELVELCFVESVGRNLDPFRLRGISGQTVYLMVDPRRREWLFVAQDGRQLRTLPAEELTAERICTLTLNGTK